MRGWGTLEGSGLEESPPATPCSFWFSCILESGDRLWSDRHNDRRTDATIFPLQRYNRF